MRFSVRRLLLAVAAISVLLGGIVFIQRVMRVPMDAYRVWNTAAALERFMEANDGAWPKSWDELIRFADAVGMTSVDGSVAALEDHVAIDFSFNPQDASARITEQSAGPGFRVVWLRSGSKVHWQGAEPNELLFDYLKSKKFQRAGLGSR